VVDLLAAAGTDVQVISAVHALQHGIGKLLTRAQQAGTVREDVHTAEVMALITSTCQGALHGGWDSGLQHRALAIIFNGLRPTAADRYPAAAKSNQHRHRVLPQAITPIHHEVLLPY